MDNVGFLNEFPRLQRIAVLLEERFDPANADAVHLLFWGPQHAVSAALPSAGIRSSGNNVLLHGPPGTGKTTIAQAASQESGATFYSVIPSSILSKYQGEPIRCFGI